MRTRLSTVRARLALLYAGLFFVTAAALVITVNLLLQHVLREKFAMSGKDIKSPLEPLPSGSAAPSAVLGDPLADVHHGATVKLTADLGNSVLAYQWTATWIVVAMLAVIGAATGWWLAGRVLRPVHRITATARRLSLSNLHERIALTGPRDELRELADTFDAMLDRLERAADSQRRFVANASHELRTPLAIQRAAIEIGLQDPSPDQVVRMRRELLENTARTERLIEGLMILAQGERAPDVPEPVDLADLVREAAAQHRGAAADAGVTVTLDPRLAPGSGDPVLLTRLAANLIENAIRYNRPGGSVAISTSTEGGTAALTVVNTGPHIPADRVPELFEPFRRLHPRRTGPDQGAGLGLSIVAAVARAHGAEISARPNGGEDEGGGLTVTVRLPAPISG